MYLLDISCKGYLPLLSSFFAFSNNLIISERAAIMKVELCRFLWGPSVRCFTSPTTPTENWREPCKYFAWKYFKSVLIACYTVSVCDVTNKWFQCIRQMINMAIDADATQTHYKWTFTPLIWQFFAVFSHKIFLLGLWTLVQNTFNTRPLTLLWRHCWQAWIASDTLQ